MGIGDALKKAAGLLVELPADEAGAGEDSFSPETEKLLDDLKQMSQSRGSAPKGTKTVEQIVRDSEGPNLEDVKVPAEAPPPVMKPDGTVDFGAIYTQAALPAVSFTAEQMLGMLGSLPPELPLDTKRQMVRVSLDSMGKAIGATPDTIVADASRKLAALVDYSENVSKQTVEFITTAELEIAALQSQIEEKRKAIEAAKQKQGQIARMCEAESDRLDDVLEFFSLDVPPSKHAKA